MDKYFDYNATTPLDESVIQAMIDHMDHYGNPSSPHRLGKTMKHLIEQARRNTASLLGAGPDTIIFTSGGSESNNAAIKGYLHPHKKAPGHLITTSVEHPSIIEIFKYLYTQYGFDVTFLPVDRHGFVSAAQLRDALRPDTQLVSVMLANNEVGAIQPIREIAEVTRARGIYLHTDAVQAVGKIPVDVHTLGVDALSFSAHKFYGPKGIGGLYLRDRSAVEPFIHGGGQEGGFRSGTENTLSIIGLGQAAELASARLDAQHARTSAMRSKLMNGLLAAIPDCQFNGSGDTEEAGAYLPNTVSVRIPQVNAKLLASQLSELYRIYVSTGSACSSNKAAAYSHVLKAMGLADEEAGSTIRISLGQYSNDSDVYYLLSALKALVANMRSQAAAVN